VASGRVVEEKFQVCRVSVAEIRAELVFRLEYYNGFCGPDAQGMLGLRLGRPTSLVLRPLRLFHSSKPTANYVGPPDPVSNIRPVLYHDLDPTGVESPRHPYSLDEFRQDSDTLKYQWKLHRQQLDAFNDAFWRDVRLSRRRAPTL
jgi:hypothetical protein